MEPFLSVVIPAFNEESNLRAGALERVAAYLAQQPYTYQVLVVDDGSEDATAALVEAFAAQHPEFQLLRNPHQGKAHTVIAGVLAAQGDIILFTDMDQATPINEVAALLPWFEQGCDVVFGSRGLVRRGAPWWRQIMSRAMVVMRGAVVNLPDVTDTQCGFKAFRAAVAHDIFRHMQLYAPGQERAVRGAVVAAGFDVETLFVARKLGYRLKEVPVTWDYARTRRVSFVRDSLRGLADLARIRINDMRGRYRAD
ncbi:MAG TPA: glycosyltransferase [Anaerolineae bacterium]|nr:glycosyltransferase [Anaerolineae bacterium]HPL30459.1 glycosyltransferase [Anaerolineae bacterium]